MMKNNTVALSDLLQVFNLVITHGSKIDGNYEYQGIKAWHDFDGYTCFLGYKDLTLTLLFHGRYTFDFVHQETMDIFLTKVNKTLVSNA
ncbi:MAG: hypothetical protein ACI9VT_003679 [Psychroserpens sp.]|jgi:hypothetical protein